MGTPILLVVAGANGSGKTTLVNHYKKFIIDIPFLNPDDIAKEIDSSYDGKDSKLILQASRKAIERQNKMLSEKKSFGLETTFSGNRELKIMRNAKSQGYDVRLVYIGLNDPKKNVKRVSDRVKQGGHFVPIDVIVRRYAKSLQNLKEGIAIANKAYFFDNSASMHKFVGKMKNKDWEKIKSLPKWLEKNLPKLSEKSEKISKQMKAHESLKSVQRAMNAEKIKKHEKAKDIQKSLNSEKKIDKSEDRGLEK